LTKDKDGVFARPEEAKTWFLGDIILIKKRQREQVTAANETEENLNVLQTPNPRMLSLGPKNVLESN